MAKIRVYVNVLLGVENINCTKCKGISTVQVPEFDKTYTVCIDCGEVLSIRFEKPEKLKKFIKTNKTNE